MDDLIQRAQSWLDAAAVRGIDMDTTDSYLTVIRDLLSRVRELEAALAFVDQGDFIAWPEMQDEQQAALTKIDTTEG